MNRDNETWMAILRGEQSGQGEALQELRDALLRILRKALSRFSHVDEAFLEDVVQDSLVRILNKLDQFHGRSRFLTWATAIAIRVGMKELRRRRWRDVSLDEVMSDGFGQASDEYLGPVFQAEQQAVFTKMYELIETELTDRQRTALLAEIKGMPLDELAHHLGSNRNAIYKLTHDARRKLKHGLEAAGYRAEDLSTAFAH